MKSYRRWSFYTSLVLFFALACLEDAHASRTTLVQGPLKRVYSNFTQTGTVGLLLHHRVRITNISANVQTGTLSFAEGTSAYAGAVGPFNFHFSLCGATATGRDTNALAPTPLTTSWTISPHQYIDIEAFVAISSGN